MKNADFYLGDLLLTNVIPNSIDKERPPMIKIVSGKSMIIEKSDDKKISIALMASFVILTIQYLILIYFDLLGTSGATRVQLISKILVGILFLYALPAVLRRSKLKFIGTYFIAIFIFIINYLIFPENQVYLGEIIFPFFFMCLPAFVYSMSINDWNVLKQIMKKASFIVFVFGTILGILIFSGTASAGTYSMSLSYYMLLPVIIYLNELLDKFSLRALLFVFISLMVILALGSRGAILCILVFVFLKLLRPSNKLNYKKVFLYIVSSGSALLIFLNLKNIFEYLYNFLFNFGIESRSIRLFLREDVHLSGRDRLYDDVNHETISNPFIGIGIGGDRRVIGGYVHNLFLEILANFGIILGTFLIITLILLIFKSLLVKDREKYNMIIIWLSLGFVHLMVSGSYITDIKFWILMGLITNSLIYKNNRLGVS